MSYAKQLAQIQARIAQLRAIPRDIDFAARHRADLERAEYQEFVADLANKIIDIGYKTLAVSLHPDKGGQAHMMEKLNAARKLLRGKAEKKKR